MWATRCAEASGTAACRQVVQQELPYPARNCCSGRPLGSGSSSCAAAAAPRTSRQEPAAAAGTSWSTQRAWQAVVVLLLALLPASTAAAGNDTSLTPVSTSTFPSNAPYLKGNELPAGTYEGLYTSTWRLIGENLDPNNYSVADSFINRTRANQAMSYDWALANWTQVAAQSATVEPCPNKNRTTDPAAANMTRFMGLDLIIYMNWTRGSLWPIMGLTTQTNHQLAVNALNSQGYRMVSWITQEINLTASAAAIMSRMPIAKQAAFQVGLMMTGPALVPFTVEKQDLMMASLQNLLITEAKVVMMKCLYVQEQASDLTSNLDNATISVMMTQDLTGSDLSMTLSSVTTSSGGPSLFSTMMLSTGGLQVNSINVTSLAYMPGISTSDQAAAAAQDTDGPNIGVIVGPVVGGVALLALVLAVVGLVIRRKRRQHPTSSHLKDPESKDGLVISRSAGSGSEPSLPNRSAEMRPQESLFTVSSKQSDALSARASTPLSGRGLHNRWDIDPEDVEILKTGDGDLWLLGEGSFGKVYRGIMRGVQDVAIKELIGTTEYQHASFRKEVEIMKSLTFDNNVCQFYGTCPKGGKTLLLLEFLEGGNLRDAWMRHGADLKWGNRGWLMALDVARGLHHLHTNKVIHCDLKTSNILLTKNFESAKVSDVGLARIMDTSSHSAANQGTFSYAAPELLLNQKLDVKADVYSFGVVLHELVTWEIPMRGRLRDIQPHECPPGIVQLIEDCLKVDVHVRPTAREAFQRIKTIMQEAQPLTGGTRLQSLADRPMNDVLNAMEGKTRLNQASWPSEASGSNASGLTCCSTSSADSAMPPNPVEGQAGYPLIEDPQRANLRLGSLHDSANSRLISPQSSKNMAAASSGPHQLGPSPLAPQPLQCQPPVNIQLTGVQHPKWVPNHGFVSPFAAFGTPQAQLQIINEASGVISSTDSTGTADHERRSLDPGGHVSEPLPHPKQH